VSLEENITLFPNPTSKRQFRCSLPNIPVNATIHVYSPKGQLLFKEKWTSSDQLFTLPQSGLFYVAIFSNDEQVTVRKVVAID
ncbi:MAG: T9SS C-terminal target domain-containing protein, partial [Bacteroidetes bacterium]